MPIEAATESVDNGRSNAATELVVSGMNCGNCARHVTEAIQSVPGIRSALVSLDSQKAAIRWAPGVHPDLPAVIQAVEQAGYGAKVAEAQEDGHAEHKLAGWHRNLWIGVLGTLPLMLGEWAFGLGSLPWFRWASFAIAAVVQIGAGGIFYRGAWNQLKRRESNMDTLVALGSTTAFVYSAWALLSGMGGHLYFMEAASIITLISVGHWFESRASARASTALRNLLDLAPPLARRRNPDGSETQLPVAQLQIGDSIALRPGDRVPTDSQVLEGESALDESMLTGESAPVEKRKQSLLYAGTVNLNGQLLARVTALGQETALAHIIAAVERAQTSRARIQRLGDRVSSVFVPIVVAIAIVAGLWWGLAPASARQVHDWLGHYLWHVHAPVTSLAAGFIVAAAVLIVACPCAMGLATPAAIMAGSNAAAQRGILIRDGVALEKAGAITAVLLDKTGTITAGKPAVVAVWAAPVSAAGKNLNSEHAPAGDQREKQALQLAASLARHSNHPFSQALASAASGDLDLEDWQEVRGAGVEGKWVPGDQRIRLGSLTWLKETGAALAPGQAFIEHWSSQGATVLALAVDQSLEALFALKDALKPGARQVVAQLRRQNLSVYMVTGDHAATAAAIAAEAGIAPGNVFAQVRPEQKAAFVSKLQTQGQRVAFVGDGINDAPALEQADLGIAVSRASDIAREAADIILLNSDIHAVPESLELARATLRTIKQNLFWAFFYNAMGVPLAALGFMSPVLCAAAMGLSDLVVIGNALRLRRFGKKSEP